MKKEGGGGGGEGSEIWVMRLVVGAREGKTTGPCGGHL